ncbi:MAG: hypothetical protein HUU02_13865 [Bacteroidetes bacterium]|nr:hypothetical protein [Bacteroidota bacterium]
MMRSRHKNNMADLQQIHSFYHSDLEMVVEEGKHRLAQSIQKIFNDWIGRKPVTPTEWMSAYIVFLNRMAKYFDTIITQISAWRCALPARLTNIYLKSSQQWNIGQCRRIERG